MDKKAMIQMLQADFVRFNQESIDFSKTLQEYKEDTISYIHALISQMSTSGSGPLLTKTPKPKKRNTRIKTIQENDENDFENSLSTTSSSSSSRADMILETSDLRPVRSKRGASVKAADIIKKQQAASLNAKLRRPGEGSDVPLANRVIRESRSKRPKESLASSDDEDIRPSKQIRVESNKAQSKSNINDETHDIIGDSIRESKVNQSIGSEKQKRGSVKRKLEEPNEDVNVTVTSEQLRKKKILSTDDEPVAKKANYSKSSPQKTEKYIQTLGRISEKSTGTKENKKSTERTTRSSTNSIINAQSKKYKSNNIINETVDTSNADETVASMYEDAIGKPLPIMNSTMNNPNCTVTLDRIMSATVLIEPLSTKKVFNETVTLKKSSFKEPLSRNNSTLKEVQEENVTQKIAATSKTIKATTQKNADLKSQYSELLTEDESSPERKQHKANKEKMSKQPKRVTRSNNNSLLSDEDEILRTPIGKNQQNKDYKGTTSKSGYKQAALFSPYAKDSVKKRVEAFEQVAISPKKGENEAAGRVTRTKTRALAAASFSETPAPTVAQKLARKSLAKAKKISLAKHAREQDDMKENDSTNIPKPTRNATNSMEKAHKSQTKTTPLGKNRMLQLPSSVNKNLHTTPSNAPTHNAYSKTLTASRGNIVTHVDSFIQPMKSASKTIDRAAEEKRRKAHEEDARRKREENLKAQAEEKRRKREEKELKNKLAREAKEKLDYEKRLRAEREREEKAKLAQQEKEKQKEEMEKKRVAQMQRAMEKEERRKQEELLRLQRLQEQEEQERQLAEQKRREQEMEKRKQMAELKMKSQMDKAMLQAKTKPVQKAVPTSYKIDSDPDEEESDDESKPKHQIPPWASKHVRQSQLAMQQHIPMKLVLRFFDAKQCTPDLRELFQGIDPKKLKRSSSAIWKTPPRYSMMNCSIIKD